MKSAVFVRDATGLVRGLKTLDALIISLTIVNLPGAVTVSVVLLGLYPGTDILWAFTLGLIPALGFVVVYSILTAAFPRAGGDYVWMSRIAGPKIGFVTSWVYLISYLLFTAGQAGFFFAWLALAPTLTSMGLVLHLPYLISASQAISSSTNLAFVVGLTIVLVSTGICLLGVRAYSLFMRVMWAYGMIGLMVWLGLVLTSTHAGFVSSFDSLMQGTASYDGIIKAAADQGLLKTGTTLTATLASTIPLTWTMYAGFNTQVFVAGETKNASRSIPLSLILGILVSYAFIVGFFFLSFNIFGTDFLYAMSSLSAAGSAVYTLPVGPSTSFLISMLTSNPVLVFMVGSALLVSWIIFPLPVLLSGSRVIFAWSFDRVIPEKLANVNDRFHSPIIALVLCGVIGVFWAYMNAYYGYILALMGISLLQALGWAVPGFIAAAFPYMKRDLYEQTVGKLPSAFSRKIGGVPILTIGGIVQGISMLIYGYSLLWPTLTFTNLSPAVVNSIESLVVIVIAGLVYYLAAKAYRKKQGLDLNMVFTQIPPE